MKGEIESTKTPGAGKPDQRRRRPWWLRPTLGLSVLCLAAVALHVSVLVYRFTTAPEAICPSISHAPLPWLNVPLAADAGKGREGGGDLALVYRLDEARAGFPSALLRAQRAETLEPGAANVEDPPCTYFTITSTSYYTQMRNTMLTSVFADEIRYLANSDMALAGVVGRFIRARFGGRLSVIDDLTTGEMAALANDIRPPEDPLYVSFRVLRVSLEPHAAASGIVCYANWSAYESQRKPSDALQALRVRLAYDEAIYVLQLHADEALAAQICAALITRPFQMGWTLLPSYLSTNWMLEATDTLLYRAIWNLDRFAWDLAVIARPPQSRSPAVTSP